jgi:hypothetical protein
LQLLHIITVAHYHFTIVIFSLLIVNPIITKIPLPQAIWNEF